MGIVVGILWVGDGEGERVFRRKPFQRISRGRLDSQRSPGRKGGSESLFTEDDRRAMIPWSYSIRSSCQSGIAYCSHSAWSGPRRVAAHAGSLYCASSGVARARIPTGDQVSVANER